MRLTEEEALLLTLYRKADSNKQCEALRVLDKKTVICSSVSELRQRFDSLRNGAKEKTGK